MMRPRLSLALLATSIALAACSSKPAPDLYVRAADAPSAPASACIPHGSLVVVRPAARDEYDTKRVAILLGNNQLTYYTGAAWASPLPDQLQGLIIDELNRSNRFTTVEGEDDTSGATTSLSMTLHEANVTHIDAPVANLRLTAVLRDTQSHRVISKIRIHESVSAEQNHMPDIVNAFDTAAVNAAQKSLTV